MTLRSSTTPAALHSSRGSTACAATSRSRRRCGRSSISSIAERPAPTQRPVMEQASSSSFRMRSCARRSVSICRLRAASALPCASCRRRQLRRQELEQLLEATVAAEGQVVLGWRDIPVRTGRGRCARQPVRAGDAPAVRRRGARFRRRPARVRAQALRDPTGGRARGRPGARDPELLGENAGLQGNADRPPARPVFPRPRRRADGERARACALTLLDEHLPELGARPSVSHDRPQRRDQHAARQRQLDSRARVAAGLGAFRQRHREARAGHSPGGLRHRRLRQRARTARALRAGRCRTR